MILYYVIILTVVVIILFMIALLIMGTLRKTRWGINLSSVYCPKCGIKMPSIRIPTSLQQAMWGGWTCIKCGCEMDKWGMAIG